MRLDSLDRALLNLVQAKFPLTMTPYADLGQWLGVSGDEVIHRIEQLKLGGLIRQIGPVVDGRSLGYQTTLVAMRVAPAELDRAEKAIAEHPGVSHGYERKHHFNLWLTLAVPSGALIETELGRLTSSIAAEAVISLPALKVFKIAVYFAMDNTAQEMVATQPGGYLTHRVELSPLERLVINELQQDLPLVEQPFATMAERLGIDEEDLLAQCQSLLQHGVMRRFAAAINHNRAGFRANAMTCWPVPQDKVNDFGRRLASLAEVSHCYERKTNPLWQYNLFAMIHAHTRKACRELASRVSQEAGLTDYVLLFSTKEFKKARIKYLV